MKLIAVLLIVSCVQLKAAALYGQTITINQRNVSMETIFESIREQTGYNFLFVDGAVPADDKFTVYEQGELKHVLSSLLHKHGLTYTIQDQTILVKPTPRNAALQPIDAGAVPAKQPAFSGTVLDGQSQPLAGATIRIKGTPQLSEEHTSELQSLIPTSYAYFCLKQKQNCTQML